MSQKDQANWAAIIGLSIATFFGLYWFWGFVFIYWAVLSVMRGTAFLLANVSRADSPVLFWAITVMWFFFGLWEIVYDVAWRFDIETFLGLPLYAS